jgi:diguanylate cyclase (GGDEF)-like protein
MKRRYIRLLLLLTGILASAGLLAAVLWQRSPLLAVALLGPLAALVLYRRSSTRHRAAMRLALTDPLTGLGNHRSFRQRVDRELATAGAADRPVSLCLLDVDDFKRINDEHGHPVGDRVLIEVARCLRHDGEAFRLGGDEFALLLCGYAEDEAAAIATTVVRRVGGLEILGLGRVTASAGAATFPQDAPAVGGEPLAATGDGA